MADQSRILEVVAIDDLPEHLVQEAVSFFLENYPSDSKKQINSKFFTAKIGPSNPNGPGYFSVALYDGKVVGTCTAVRKTLLSDNKIVHAVEIGDTFTSKNFRRNCSFSKLYPGTTNFDEYLNKSIFGRLATETLDRARNDGVQYVYGTPNFQAKLSWLGRMNFRLVDGDYTYRINSASITHKLFSESKAIYVLGLVFTRITYLYCFIATRKYSLSLISKQEFDHTPEFEEIEKGDTFFQIVNSDAWLSARFINNDDKEYRIVCIKNRKNGEICGYQFFTEHERKDDFRLLILSKDIFYVKNLGRLKIPLAKIAADKFFAYENLSIWVDCRKVSLRYRAFCGFISKKFKVDIVGKSLTENGQELEYKNFYNFQYGDSDLA